ncbi:hypothetical protein [Histidinibacterium aquaticum]|uniref:Uncharacterized protein n=1 Tax=Histidinibacterium aquaticum TaxID=2613962 RepID=A0A5J5GNS4_9RHOB|nr:hypothetical protein [Histidinibacterium aquaticum]KAA9009184.1 hypothetical protein F3S47_07990 [Histidinibacterium aquaticum]
MEHILPKELERGPVLLVIGPALAEGRDPGALDGFHFCDFTDLDAGVIEGATPEIVISPLFGPNFDAMELARKLNGLGYSGSYRALSEELPRTDLIKREVRAAAPGIDFDILPVSALFNL